MTEEQTSSGTEFLIAEYQEIYLDHRRKREEGFQRLNFLITLTTTILGGLSVLFQLGSLSEIGFQLIALGATFFLIIVAWGTYDFTIYRDIYADKGLRAAARIRQYFLKQSPEIYPHLSWELNDEPTFFLKNNLSSIRRTTQIIFAFLCGLFIAIVVNLIGRNLTVTSISGTLVAVAVWAILLAYTKSQLTKASLSAMSEVRFPRLIDDSQEVKDDTNIQTDDADMTINAHED